MLILISKGIHLLFYVIKFLVHLFKLLLLLVILSLFGVLAVIGKLVFGATIGTVLVTDFLIFLWIAKKYPDTKIYDIAKVLVEG